MGARRPWAPLAAIRVTLVPEFCGTPARTRSPGAARPHPRLRARFPPASAMNLSRLPPAGALRRRKTLPNRLPRGVARSPAWRDFFSGQPEALEFQTPRLGAHSRPSRLHDPLPEFRSRPIRLLSPLAPEHGLRLWPAPLASAGVRQRSAVAGRAPPSPHLLDEGATAGQALGNLRLGVLLRLPGLHNPFPQILGVWAHSLIYSPPLRPCKGNSLYTVNRIAT